MMRFSIKMSSDYVNDADKMRACIDMFYSKYRLRVSQFRLAYEAWDLNKSTVCTVCLYGDLIGGFKLWKDYHKTNWVGIGW